MPLRGVAVHFESFAMVSSEYLETDELSDTLDALDHCVCSLRMAIIDTRKWKWAIIALHNALQGALVCRLSGTAGIGALTKDDQRKTLEWHERDGRGDINYLDEGVDVLGLPVRRSRHKADQHPEGRLAGLGELYKRAQEAELMGQFGGRPLTPTQQQNKSVCLLISLRNDFMHFSPKSWSIELSGLPLTVRDCMDLIESLILDHANPLFLEKDRIETAHRTLEALRQQISQVES